MTIREETEADFLEIAAITRAAFGGEYEVGLIKKLRTPRLKIASHVAVQEGSVVGHSGKAFMGLELVAGALSGNRGSVTYPEAFGV
jgi:predicted N-acetyltransferase YhbS